MELRLPMKPIVVLFGFIFFIILFLHLPVQEAVAQACTPITTAPNLYQIDKASSSATLYFTPISNATSYTAMYGFSVGDARYNTNINYGQSTGAISYTIGNLDPGLHYYFEVRANNSCSTGPFSSWVADSPNITPSLALGGGGALPVTGIESYLGPALLSFGVLLFGFLLFVL